MPVKTKIYSRIITVLGLLLLLIGILNIVGKMDGFAPVSQSNMKLTDNERQNVLFSVCIGLFVLYVTIVADIWIVDFALHYKFQSISRHVLYSVLAVCFVAAVALVIGSLNLMGYMNGIKLISQQERDKLTGDDFNKLQNQSLYFIGGAIAPFVLYALYWRTKQLFVK